MQLCTADGATWSVNVGLSTSERKNNQARDQLKVSKVDGQQREAERKSGSSNQQVGKWNCHAIGLLFAVDLAGQQRCFSRVGVHSKIV